MLLVVSFWLTMPAAHAQFNWGGNASTLNRPIADKWALVIGVSKFQDPTIPQLKYAAKDAQDFAHFLVKEQNFARDHVRVLINEKATRKQILTELGDKFLPRVVKQDDLVLVFYSSHGSPAGKDVRQENFLVTYDTEKNNLWATAIDIQDLARILRERANADRILIVMDACHSGGAIGAKAMDGEANFNVNNLPLGEGQCLVSSSAEDQRSWESNRYQNGVFTYQLMAGLRKGRTLLEALKSAQQNVVDEVQQDQAVKQTPVINNSKWHGNDLVLAALPTRPHPLPESVKKLLDENSNSSPPATNEAPTFTTAPLAMAHPRTSTQPAKPLPYDHEVQRPKIERPSVVANTSTPQSSSGTYGSRAKDGEEEFWPADRRFRVIVPSNVTLAHFGNKNDTYSASSPTVTFRISLLEVPTTYKSLNQGVVIGLLDSLYQTGICSKKSDHYQIDGYDALDYKIWTQDGSKQGKLVIVAGINRIYAFLALSPNPGNWTEMDQFFNSIQITK
jgi:hypothetical protein